MSLSPGKKLGLIRESAGVLDSYGWPELDLILRTFGFPTSDTWSSPGKYDYALSQLENGPEEKLGSLNAYLLGKEEREISQERAVADLPAENNLPWRAGLFRLFISHLAEQKLFASELKLDLLSCGIDGFVAHEDIVPSREWQSRM